MSDEKKSNVQQRGATMLCSGVSAAPLTDYSVGKTAIDMVVRSSISIDGADVSPSSYDKKN